MQVDFRKEMARHVTDEGSQSALARRLGVKQSYVSKLIRGSQAPSDRILKALGMTRVIVRILDAPKPLTVREAELSVRTGNQARLWYGDDVLLSDLCAKTDEELKSAGFMRKSIKEIREIGEML